MTAATTSESVAPEPRLLGQTVVVIGGSAGIGLETATLSGRLTARVPVRLLLGTGLAFVTLGLLLMGNLSD